MERPKGLNVAGGWISDRTTITETRGFNPVLVEPARLETDEPVRGDSRTGRLDVDASKRAGDGDASDISSLDYAVIGFLGEHQSVRISVVSRLTMHCEPATRVDFADPPIRQAPCCRHIGRWSTSTIQSLSRRPNVQSGLGGGFNRIDRVCF